MRMTHRSATAKIKAEKSPKRQFDLITECFQLSSHSHYVPRATHTESGGGEAHFMLRPKNEFKMEWLGVFDFSLGIWGSKEDKWQIQLLWWWKGQRLNTERDKRGDKWMEGQSLVCMTMCWISFSDSTVYNWCQKWILKADIQVERQRSDIWVTSLFYLFNRPPWCLLDCLGKMFSNESIKVSVF